ncbi:MAG: hypothetical protein ACREXT_00945 [Gammaproteobacteria bacterium]
MKKEAFYADARHDLADLNGVQRIARREELDGILAAWCALRARKIV